MEFEPMKWAAVEALQIVGILVALVLPPASAGSNFSNNRNLGFRSQSLAPP